jgi:urease accessory protein
LLLRLIQLSDSALPIGSASHSFGLESLIADGLLSVDGLQTFLTRYVAQVGHWEAVCCYAGYHCGDEGSFDTGWVTLNQHISAVRTARESRAASLALGRRFLHLVLDVLHASGHTPDKDGYDRLNRATATEKAIGGAHQSAAFGLAAAALGIPAELAAAAFLGQSLTCLVSACQRLMPLGQSQAMALLWAIKPEIVRAADAAASVPITEVALFLPALEVASMRHPMLTTRLFIS